MEFSSKGTYLAMVLGAGFVMAVAVIIFNVASPNSGATQSVSPAFVSQNGTRSREQPSPLGYARTAPTVRPSATQGPVQIDRTPPRITYFVPPDADQSVKDALSDGIVTFEEYTQAVYNTMACLDEKGVEHTQPVYNEARAQYEYEVVSASGPGGMSEYDECHMRFERDVQGAWAQANQHLVQYDPVDEEAALECAVKFGLDAETFDDIVALKRANPQDPEVQSCFFTGLMGFDPSVPR